MKKYRNNNSTLAKAAKENLPKKLKSFEWLCKVISVGAFSWRVAIASQHYEFDNKSQVQVSSWFWVRGVDERNTNATQTHTHMHAQVRRELCAQKMLHEKSTSSHKMTLKTTLKHYSTVCSFLSLFTVFLCVLASRTKEKLKSFFFLFFFIRCRCVCVLIVNRLQLNECFGFWNYSRAIFSLRLDYVRLFGGVQPKEKTSSSFS